MTHTHTPVCTPNSSLFSGTKQLVMRDGFLLLTWVIWLRQAISLASLSQRGRRRVLASFRLVKRRQMAAALLFWLLDSWREGPSLSWIHWLANPASRHHQGLLQGRSWVQSADCAAPAHFAVCRSMRFAPTWVLYLQIPVQCWEIALEGLSAESSGSFSLRVQQQYCQEGATVGLYLLIDDR